MVKVLVGPGPFSVHRSEPATMNTFTKVLSPLTQLPQRKRFSELLAQALHVHLHVSRFYVSKEATKQRRARIPSVRGSARAGATRYLPVPGAPFTPFTPGALGELRPRLHLGSPACIYGASVRGRAVLAVALTMCG